MDELFDGKYVSVVLSKVISLKAAKKQEWITSFNSFLKWK